MPSGSGSSAQSEFLWERATRSFGDPPRARADSPLRTPFQRDRDRIVHSKGRFGVSLLTQVFIAPEGDHYRTRLTHTLETGCIARTVARALGLNEDLTEAVGLDTIWVIRPSATSARRRSTGRCASGGAGVQAQSPLLRVVDVLERDGQGLNLTEAVRDGILNHTGPQQPATFEGRVVRLVDRVAYINHDIDDAVRKGILAEADLPAAEIELLGPTGAERIDTLVRDIVATFRASGTWRSRTRSVARCQVAAQVHVRARVSRARVYSEHDRVPVELRGLFDHYLDDLDLVADGAAAADDLQRVTDYIAGTTDRFAIALLRRLALPEESRL